MPEFHVHMINEVSTVVSVEAETPDEAIELAFDSDGMPSSITVGAFGPTVVDDGEWNPYLVTDANGNEVHREPLPSDMTAAEQAVIAAAREWAKEFTVHDPFTTQGKLIEAVRGL